MDKRIAYCSQTPWLPNTTIRKAVTRCEDDMVDEAWYKSCLRACALNMTFLCLSMATRPGLAAAAPRSAAARNTE